MDEAVTIAERLEGRIKTAQWLAVSSQGTLLDPEDLEHRTPTGSKDVWHAFRVFFEPGTHHYRVEKQGVSRWADGTAPFGASSEIFANDGRTERYYQRFLPGTKVPDPGEGAQQGSVQPATVDGFPKPLGASGLGFFAPYFFERPFSEWLRKKARDGKPLSITADDQGHWRIVTVQEPWPECRFWADYDPEKGGVVRAAWVGPDDARVVAARGVDWLRYDFRWKQRPNGLWVVEKYYKVNLLQKSYELIEYKDLEVNEPIDASLFRIDFPKGTRVTDEVERKTYKVTGGAVDDQQAIRDFMAAEGLANQPVARSRSNYWVQWAVGGPVVFVGLVWLVGRRRWRRPVAVGVLVLALRTPAAPAAELDAEGNWVVSHGDRKPIRISHCGLNASLFALEYFQAAYQLKAVVAGLPLTEEGIRLADIKDMLEAHGLDVVAREHVRFADLPRVVRAGVVALFPIRVGGERNHYVLMVDHPDRGGLVVDPPRAAVPYPGGVTESAFDALDGTVLFVRAGAREPRPAASEVAVDPASTQVGVFPAADPRASRPHDCVVALENRSDRATLVARVTTPCGCLKADWPGGLLPAGQRRELHVTLLPSAFGPGRVERQVTFQFADGSEAVAGFVVENQPGEPTVPKASVVPPVFHEVLGAAGGTPPIRREGYVYVDGAAEAGCSVSTDTPWLTAALQADNRSRLRLRVQIEPGKLPPTPRAEAEVTVSGRFPGAPLRARVIVTREEAYRVQPPVVSFVAGEPSAAEVVVRPSNADAAPLTGLEIISCPDGIEAKVLPPNQGAISVRLRAPSGVDSGSHLVKLAPRPARPVDVPIVVVVQAKRSGTATTNVPPTSQR